MERSTVTGKHRSQRSEVRGRSFEATVRLSRLVNVKRGKLLTARRSLLTALGFTLLELMIVISIIIILASVALPQYQKTIMHARETVLHDDLFKMRSLLDQYAADKGKLPQTLDDLVTEHYLREVPKDPITDNKEWTLVTGDDPYSTEGSTGITDVHSSSGDTSTEGTPYSEW
jgi:general secretion pathway protein G